MAVCYFGNYKKNYSRNRIIIRGLIENGISLVECNTRERGLKKFLSLYRQHREVGVYDVMIVGFSGYSVMWFAKMITKKPIVFDAFSSLYLSDVIDRKKHAPKSMRARYLRFLETLSYKKADKVLYDTNAQIDYVVNEYGVPREKFERVLVGSDIESVPLTISQGSLKSGRYTVHWHGNVVPFAGAETIVDSAIILKDNKDILFQMVAPKMGAGNILRNLAEKHNLNNIEWHDTLPYNKLVDKMRKADICLGVFGDNEKTQRVIPNKIYEALASGKHVITADHAVINELPLVNGIIRIPPRNPKALAESILQMAKRETIETSSVITVDEIGKQVRKIIEQVQL